jgi:uncharacterized membrane protein YadS
MSPEVASVAVVTKLLRVCLLEPWLLLLFYFGPTGLFYFQPAGAGPANTEGGTRAGPADTRGGTRVPWLAARAGPANTAGGTQIPWFAVGFFAVAAYNSIFGFGAAVSRAFAVGSATCLAAAMAALGLDADLGKIRELGPKPILLAAVLWANLLYGGLLAARFFLTAFP